MDFRYGLLVTLVIAASLVGDVRGQSPDDDCPFTPGSCPVTLDNVADVYFHDFADQVSCQRQCQLLPECKFFTMFGVKDDPKDHMKCFLFKTCDHLEPCPDCITGPEFPPIDKSNCTYDGNTTCSTDLDNIVDVYYFDVADRVSCYLQCKLLDTCLHWTQFSVYDDPKAHNKCFLFKNCDVVEPCDDCETGPRNSVYHENLYQDYKDYLTRLGYN